MSWGVAGFSSIAANSGMVSVGRVVRASDDDIVVSAMRVLHFLRPYVRGSAEYVGKARPCFTALTHGDRIRGVVDRQEGQNPSR